MKTDTPLTGSEPEGEDVEFLAVYRSYETVPSDPWVRAEELHRFLAVCQDFLPWMEAHIRPGHFVERTDYIRVQRMCRTASGTPKRRSRGSPDFDLRLDMALSMAQSGATERGIQAARYLADKRMEWLAEKTIQAQSPEREEALRHDDTRKIGRDRIVHGMPPPSATPSGTGHLVDRGMSGTMNPATETEGSKPHITLDFGGRALRILMKDGEPRFIAGEVCTVLGIANHRDAVSKLDDDEKGVGLTDTLGGKQETTVINESGLYALILRCRDAVRPGTTAHRFRKWVTREVLPAIHKRGHYETKPSQGQLARDSVWLYDGSAENLDLKVPDVPAIEAGYVFLLGLSNGGIMLCASSKPAVNTRNLARKFAGFSVAISRIVVTRPHRQYLLLRTRLLKPLAELPRVGQTFKGADLETVMARVEPLLREAFSDSVPLNDVDAAEAKLQALISEASRLVETLKQAERARVSGPG